MKFSIEAIRNFFDPKLSHETTLTGREKRISGRLQRTRRFKAEMQQDERRKAIMMAEDPERHDRTLLYSIYYETVEDSHVASQIRVTKNKIIAEPFEVYYPNQEMDEELTELLKRPWFDKYIEHAFMSEFWGHSLVEFDDPVESESGIMQKEFRTVRLIPREHVKPEEGVIVLRVTDHSGLPFREGPLGRWLIEIGDPESLGLLKLISREVIWKNYSRSDWSRHSEKFGMPILVIKTITSNDRELDRLEEKAANFGNNGYVIIDDNDDFQIGETKGSTSGAAHHIYKDLIEVCNEEVSKAMNGQTLTGDEGSSRAQGEVHERILNAFIKGRLRELQNHVNFKLFPFLIDHGYPLKGARFRYPILENSDIDKTPDPTGEKKKIKPNLTLSIGTFYSNTCGHSSSLEMSHKKKYYSLVDKVAKQLHDGRIDRNQIFDTLYLEIAKELFQSFKSSYTGSGKITWNMPDNNFLLTIQNNLFAFSAAKNYSMMKEMRDGVFRDGKLVPWPEYQDYIKGIKENYVYNWLATERNMVRRAGALGSKWMRIQRDKDLYPYLQYKTVADGNVRESHAALHNLILPINDRFWNNYYPPNGWNCRCTVEQISERELQSKKQFIVKSEDANRMGGENVKDKYWKRNVGNEQSVFDLQKHTYWKHTDNLKLNNLKAVENYNLRTIKKIYADPNKLPLQKAPFIDREDFLKWWKGMEEKHGSLDNPNEFILESSASNHLIKFDKSFRDHGKNRWEHYNEILNFINRPHEVFSDFYSDHRMKGKVYSTYYIRYFGNSDNPWVLITETSKNGMVAKSLYEITKDGRNINDIRKGLLLYRK